MTTQDNSPLPSGGPPELEKARQGTSSMVVDEVDAEEFRATIPTPFSVFDSVAFSQLNAARAERIAFLVFRDRRPRFGLVVGEQRGVLKAPFSAPFACISAVFADEKTAPYAALGQSLAAYARHRSMDRVRLTLPPNVYDEHHLSAVHNSLFLAAFQPTVVDLNFHYALDRFSESYEATLDIKARQKLRAALRSGLSFEQTTDLDLTYRIIQDNRAAKGYPLRMTLDGVRETSRVVAVDCFVVRDANHTPVASALLYHVRSSIVQLIYWGNVPDSDGLRPMNFLAFHLLAHYKSMGFTLLDFGPASENGIPNVGLCDFKRSIGCTASSKFTYELDVLRSSSAVALSTQHTQ
ncbi:MAG: hypothetical protein IT353_05245 [Gemmatimonadaceae bacterium]|nr:hypothetical protein [Gemmatimonadaceae bacterium]